MNYMKFKKTAGVAIDETITPSGPFQIEDVRIHLGAASATSENIVVSLDAVDGAEYDVVFNAQDMNALTDYIWQPTRPYPCDKDDKINIAWLNTNAETYGLTVRWRLI